MTTDTSPNLIATAAVFVTPNLRATVDFYVEKLGFSCDIDWAPRPTFAICNRDGAAIMLKEADKASAPLRELTPGLDLFDAYIWIQDLAALKADFERRGASIAVGPVERPYGCTEVAVHDPDGRLICFGHCP